MKLTKKVMALVLASCMTLFLAACGGKPTLAEWVESEDVTTAEDTINATSASTGMRAEFSAEGEDILVFSCTYLEQLPLDGTSQEDIETYFSSALSGITSTMDPMFTACEQATGVKLQCIRVKYINADGSEVYSYDFANPN